MRTLRLSLAGTVILMLLRGLGAVVAGDDETLASERPHQVSGSCVYAGHRTFGAYVEEDGRTGRHGDLVRVGCEMDDARLSGSLWVLSNMDAIGGRIRASEGEVMAQTVELVNDDGSWVGTNRGYIAYEPLGRVHYWQLELTGTGVYEGHSALLQVKGPGTGPYEVEGFVFPGALPEYPGPVEVPAE